MKNKRLLIAFLLIAGFLVSYATQAQPTPSLDYDPVEVLDENMEIITPLAQNDLAPTVIQNNPTSTPNYNPPSIEPSSMEKYGFLGFTLFTCLSLVVFVVKKDRETMSEQNESFKDLIKAIGGNTAATKELAMSLKGEIRQIGANLNLRFDALEKSVDRGFGGD